MEKELKSNLPVDNAIDDYMIELVARLVNALVLRLKEQKLIVSNIEWYDPKNERKFTLTWEDRK